MSSPEPALRILVVCTGNTCRSPLVAAALLDELGPDRERVEILSAGTAATEGQPATASSIDVAGRDGLDLSAHRSRRLTPALARAADRILVMEREHARAVLALGGDPRRTHVLNEWPEPGEPQLPVSDPYGASIEAYEECWRRIRHHVSRVVAPLREELRARSA